MLTRLTDPATKVSGTYDYILEVYIEKSSQLEYLASDFDDMAEPLKNYKRLKIIYSALVEQWNKVYPIGTKVTSDFYDTELETRNK